jgi:uncharacterized protein YkwD
VKSILFYFGLLTVLIAVFYNLSLNVGTAGPPKELPTPEPTRSLMVKVSRVFDLVNDHREKNGLNRLIWDEQLCRMAKERVNEIHTDFTHSGAPYKADTYYPNRRVGENIMKSRTTGDNEAYMVEGWIESPSHLENIVRPNFVRSCIAADWFDNKNYAVQIFSD